MEQTRYGALRKFAQTAATKLRPSSGHLLVDRGHPARLGDFCDVAKNGGPIQMNGAACRMHVDDWEKLPSSTDRILFLIPAPSNVRNCQEMPCSPVPGSKLMVSRHR